MDMVSNVNVNPTLLSDPNAEFKQLLTRWSEAVSCFCCLNAELVTLIARKQAGRNAESTSMAGFVGQCSVRELMTVQVKMTQQLEYLLIDMDTPGNEDRVAMFKAHITVIETCSNRIKRTLYLASLPAC